MKSKIILLFISLISTFQLSFSQDNEKIKGNWLGTLKVSTMELRIVFKVSENEDGSLKAALDSPDQGAFDIPVDSVLYNDPNIKFLVSSIGGFYEGKFEQDSIAGTWNQGGSSFPLTLKKSGEIEPPKRPQEPRPPFPYNEELVSIENKEADLTLAGTITYPKEGDSFPVVILISGSGPQNRDEELLGHKPFLVLTDHLTRNGIAVLRFDDRGVGESTGDFSSSTTKDFASDVLAGVEYMKTYGEGNHKIGLIGHSEGGLIAPLVANQSDDVDFIVLMAGPGMRGKELLLLQSALILRANGVDEEEINDNVETSLKMYDIVVNEKDSLAAREKLKKISDESYAEMSEEEKAQFGDPEKFFYQQANILLSPWFRFFLAYDPYPVLTKMKIPLLAINGEKDLQVPPKENLELIEKAMKEGGNKNYKIAELQGLNHLFQESETGLPNEYAKIEQTFSPTALSIISDWIKEITK